MASKNITITEEAYERLLEYKREDESFTESILRLTGSERDVMTGFAAMTDVDGFREAVAETRDDVRGDEAFRDSGDATFEGR